MTTTVQAGPGPWYALLTGSDGYVITDLDAAIDQYGPEAIVSITIRRDEAILARIKDGLPVTFQHNQPGDAYDVDIDLIDEDGETKAVQKMYDQAKAMASGLNRAEANDGDFNRGTDLAASLHDLANRLAAYDGALPNDVHLAFPWWYHHGVGPDDVDQLATALFDQTGEPKQESHGWIHRAAADLPGRLHISVYTNIPAPAEEDPAALRAGIAELEQRLAEGGEQA